MELALLPTGPTGKVAKAMGAYYTDAAVARFLVGWGLRSSHETLADPAFGGGIFLAAASKRIQELGGSAGRQIYGVELDQNVHERTAATLEAHFALSPNRLIRADFFDLEPPDMQVDVVLGNPPYIRYQRFSGAGREKALRRVATQGVKLSHLAGSWAAFVVYAGAFLKPGGRLGMVVPAELCHAAYARPVLQYLARAFERITLITFRDKLFPRLSQDTLLLLAEGRRECAAPTAVFDLLDVRSSADLANLHLPSPHTQELNTPALCSGQQRLPLYWIPHTVRELYLGLRGAPQTFALGEATEVGIGYVTGHNNFFHLSPAQTEQWGIPPQFLKPAVRRGRAFRGLRFTEADWEQALAKGEACFLLHLPPETGLPAGVRSYLEYGQAAGIQNAYKCRIRKPWYAIPHLHPPGGFLTYMSGQVPHLVANEAGAVAPNSLHVVRQKLQVGGPGIKALAALWQTSLTKLSAELEGHAMGGGMLKLEPTEAEKVVLARPALDNKVLEALADELDVLLRKGMTGQAQRLADRVILLEGLGLAQKEIDALFQAGQYLRRRRQRKLADL